MLRKTILALALAACGSKQPAPAAAAQGHDMQGMKDMDMHMSPELAKFHDALAPRWHAEKGPKRMQDTCSAVGEFKTDADAIAKATPPEKANADTWTTGTRELVASVAGLEQACGHQDQAAGFEDAFAKVHQSFHHLLEASGAMHCEHCEHEEHGA